MVETNTCQHDALVFASGDYYVCCAKCHRRWGQLLDGQPEYGTDKDGKAVGCHHTHNPGFNPWTPYRVKTE